MAKTEKHYTPPLPEFDRPVKVLIVVAPYYRDIADTQIAAAQSVLDGAGVAHDLVEVPGALEIPAAVATAQRLSNFDGFVALGCVIRGETTHYETVCNDSSRGLMLLNLQGAAIGNGILTVENRDQAEVRADPAGHDTGGGAARAALHLIGLARKWGGAGGSLGFKPSPDSYQIAGKAGSKTT